MKRKGLLQHIHDHSLSLVLAGMTIAFKLTGGLLPDGYWQDFCQGFGDDTWGAFVVVVATKYFMEKGSPQSDDGDKSSGKSEK